MKLCQKTREEIQHSTKSTFTPVQTQGECCPRVLFEKDSQPQFSGRKLYGCLSERRGDQSRQRGPC